MTDLVHKALTLTVTLYRINAANKLTTELKIKIFEWVLILRTTFLPPSVVYKKQFHVGIYAGHIGSDKDSVRNGRGY